MTPEERVYSILAGNAGVTDLVPSGRIKVPGDLQGVIAPYIVHFPVAAEPTNCHEGPQALRIWRFYQVSVYAVTYSSGRAVATAVEAALDGYRDVDIDRIALVRPAMALGYDTDLKLQHFALDFEIAGALA